MNSLLEVKLICALLSFSFLIMVSSQHTDFMDDDDPVVPRAELEMQQLQKTMIMLEIQFNRSVTDLLSKTKTLENIIIQSNENEEFLEERLANSSEHIRSLEQQLKESTYKVDDLEKEIENLKRMEEARQEMKANFRNCEEIRSADPSKVSGEYLIDPDGPAGDEPILVFCDMASGSTLIWHDAEEWADMEHCLGHGCLPFFHRQVTYRASMKQISRLVRRSRQCRQQFYQQFECDDESSHRQELGFFWWNDRNNLSRDFHSCAVNEKGGSLSCVKVCTEPTKGNQLPITRLNWSRRPILSELQELNETSSRSRYSLGRLKCWGLRETKGSMGLSVEAKRSMPNRQFRPSN